MHQQCQLVRAPTWVGYLENAFSLVVALVAELVHGARDMFNQLFEEKHSIGACAPYGAPMLLLPLEKWFKNNAICTKLYLTSHLYSTSYI
jgi:hypothetical protein